MRATAGASRRPPAGYIGVVLLLALAGLAFVGVMLAPNLVLKTSARTWKAEEKALEDLRRSFLITVESTGYIPTATNWSSCIADYTRQDQTAIEQVYTGFPSDTNTRRILLVDPLLTSGALPFTQDDNGLAGASLSLIGTNARVMLVSNTKRSLTLPVTNSTITSSTFNAIWNWTYNPANDSPPSGWPSAWNGNGEYLHVSRLDMANLFHTMTLKNLHYGMGNTNLTPNSVTAQTSLDFLRGSRLVIADTTDTLKRIHIVNRDDYIDFSTTSTNVAAVIRWRIDEKSGSTANNLGSGGSSINGTYVGSAINLNVAGPRSPTYANFATTNVAAFFDGGSGYVNSSYKLTNSLPAFTLGCWFKPTGWQDTPIAFLGVNNSLDLEYYKGGGNKIKLYTANGGSLIVSYPYDNSTWIQMTAVGDGTSIKLYFNGALVGTTTASTANYFYDNGNTFQAGAFDVVSGNRYYGYLDEIVLYYRALSASEVATLATGVLP